MQRIKSIILNVIFSVQILLLFLLFFENRIVLPIWLQVAGRLHPALLHLPIGLLAFLAILLVAQSKFTKEAFHTFTVILLILISFTSSITALFGFFLYRQGDFGAEVVKQHKISGIVLSVLCYLLILLFDCYEKKRVAFLSLAFVTMAVVVFVGHTGGTLTHGENYVFAPLQTSSETMPLDSTVFRKAVYPILEKKCISCHNKTKPKGKLVMTSVAEFMKGGKEGVEWVEGNPDESRMIKYIQLPLEHDDHMPPDGKPQLSKLEISMLQSWIKAGADFDKILNEVPEEDTLKLLATALANATSKPLVEKHYEFSAASAKTIEELNSPFRTVFSVYRNSPALQADFFVRKSFDIKSLEELRTVKDQLVVLNLSKMPVTDNDLKIIENFKNLETLNLNFTEIKGAGLTSMKSLEHLTSLSLAGTEVKMQDIKTLMELPSLTELFIWNTKISEEEKQQLVKNYPKVVISTSQFKDNTVLRLTKPVLVNEGILTKEDKTILKHAMPGVTIRYTLDGSKPDSVTSLMYEAPIALGETTKIKAVACKQGWYCSDMLEVTCFVEGIKPKHGVLLSPPDKKYPGEGAITLTDGRKGFVDNFLEPAWLGYTENPFVAEFDFGSNPPAINKIVLSNGENLGSYIFPPKVIEVWGGENSNEIKLIKTRIVEQPTDYRSARTEALMVSFNTSTYSFYKIVAKPVTVLPLWHSGKGKKGWFFVDEVFFY